jgi:hypothetical protein
MKLLEAHPYLDDMLQDAFKSGSYKDFRNLGGSLQYYLLYWFITNAFSSASAQRGTGF